MRRMALGFISLLLSTPATAQETPEVAPEAAAADVAAIETVYPDFRNLDGLAAYCARAMRDGFTGMMAIHPAQVDPINAAFTPSAEELAHARAVVQAFAEHPGAGVVALDGAMLDRPHLALAQRLLAEAGEK